MHSKVCVYSFLSLEFPNSGDKDGFYLPSIGRGPSYERFISHFQRERLGLEWGISSIINFPHAVSQVN